MRSLRQALSPAQASCSNARTFPLEHQAPPAFPRRPTGLACAVAVVAALGGSPALALVIDVGLIAGATVTTEQMSAFNAAADAWERIIADPVTVGINIGFANVAFASSAVFRDAHNYADIRSRLASRVTSELDSTVVSFLPAGNSIAFWGTNANGSTGFDSNGSTNNTALLVSSANAKALGFAGATVDGTVEFSDTANFQYRRNADGSVNTGAYDFVTVAMHEIAHILGFTSGVDRVDRRIDPDAAADTFESEAIYSPLDLFRYSSEAGPDGDALGLDFRVGQEAFFSVDGGLIAFEDFSTGQLHGDGYQASHWRFGSPHLMAPVIFDGTVVSPFGVDILALDAVGWTIVPEPSTALLFAVSGLCLLLVAGGRQEAAPPAS